MQKVPLTLTRLESSPAAFRHTRPEPRRPSPPVNINPLASLRRHPQLALLAVLLIFVAGYTWLYFRYDRNYYSESIIFVSPGYPEILPQPLAMNHLPQAYDLLIEQQVTTVTRRDILIRAIRQLPASYFPTGSDPDKADVLAAQLSVHRIPTTSRIAIGLHGANPDRIATIINHVTQSYLDSAQKEQFFGRDQAIAALQRERDQLAQDMAARQDELARIEHELGIATFNPSLTNPYNERVTRLNSDLVDARNKLHNAESEFEHLQPDRQSASDAAHAVSGSKARRLLQERYRSNLLRARDFEARISHDLAVAQADAALAAPRFQHIEELTSAIAYDADRIHTIEDRIASLNIAGAVPGSIQLFSAAERPERAGNRQRNILLLLLVPLSLSAGLAAAIARDVFDQTIYSPADVQRAVGLPPVGILFDSNEVSNAIENEYVFRLAATLDHARSTANISRFALTSVRAEQDTTTIVTLLARELAQLGNRVLVLDTVDRKEPVAFIPPEQEDPNSNPRARLLYPDLGFTVNSRGRNLPSIQTVVESFRRLHGDFDILLLDCAPLLLSAEVEYQVRQADTILLIAEAGATRKPDLLRAARLLDRLRVRGLAILLNRLQLDRANAEIRNDIKAFELYGQRVSYYPQSHSPFIDGGAFRTPKTDTNGTKPPRHSRLFYDEDDPTAPSPASNTPFRDVHAE